MQRKLTAIVAADVVGYSRMMGVDETGTIAAVRRLRDDMIEPLLARHGGRMVKTMGDGFLMEFASVVAGTEAALALQGQLADAADDLRIVLRIGIHMGDVVIDGADLFGDGVNIAARIEGLAQPGGIGISEDAFQQVQGRVPVSWTDGGLAELKNIARPIRVWHWDNGAAPAHVAEPLPTLPDKPSVAVLPFDNMSEDPEQVHFADGLSEDLITDLSKISGLFVVARNSTFVFKGQAVDVPTVGRKLGVRNVIEGSVRKAGDRVRINVQLIDVESGGHVWADRFDGSLASVFELQDDVCQKVVDALSVRLTVSETQNLNKVHTNNVDAYELYAEAKLTPYPPIPGRIAAARALFERVIDMAPEFAGGYAGLSWMTGFDAIWNHDGSDERGVRAEALAYKAISVDDSFGWSYTALGLAFLAQRRFEEMMDAGLKGLEKLPNDADAHAFLALFLTMRGQETEAQAAIDQALRLSPNFINGPYLNIKCQCLLLAGRYEQALEAYDQNVNRGGPVGPPALAWAAACHQAMGRHERANQIVDEIDLRFPGFRIRGWNLPNLIESETSRANLLDLFRDAGLPD